MESNSEQPKLLSLSSLKFLNVKNEVVVIITNDQQGIFFIIILFTICGCNTFVR